MLPAIIPAATALTTAIGQVEEQRVHRFAAAWKRYDGDAPKALAIPRQQRGKPAPADDNVRLNFHRLLVDTGVWYLFGDELAIDLDAESRDRNGDEQALDAAWPMERRMLDLMKAGINGGVTGHSFAKVMPATAGRVHPRVIILDPGTVTPSWEGDDIEEVYRYRIEYTATTRQGKPRRYRQVHELNDAGTGWTIIDYEAEPNGEWSEVNREEWPHAWSQVVGWQNLPRPNEYWGTADLESDVIELGDRINRVVSNVNRIIRIHAHPKTTATGLRGEQEIDVSPGGVIKLPEGVTMEMLEMKSDLKGSLDFAKLLVDVLHELTETPAIATGKMDGVGQLSSLAMKVLFAPLVAKTKMKRLTYGLGTRGIAQRILAIEKGGELDSRTPVFGWPEVIPVSEKEEAETLTVDRDNGLSEETYLERRGYDPSKERKRRQAESEGPVPPANGGNDRAAARAALDAFDRGQA